MAKIIEINGLCKEYPIVHDTAKYGTLRDTIASFVKNPFKSNITHETFGALDNVNLTIDQGDIIGIIGKNGAGKSTLLKIISGIIKPTRGKIKLWGRVSSLLEVGTGFHPELTGRENIFLNGIILGMSRKEVQEKFDEIVDFAGIEKFLDTPVKHYSSGMYVRLAFAVAAHLEPEILIVDEVLAVGDAEFQKKCLGKINQVSKEEGRTVIFVSHDMHSVMSLANRCILLENGKVIADGKTEQVVSIYSNRQQAGSSEYKSTKVNGNQPRIDSVNIQTSDEGNTQRCLEELKIHFKIWTPRPIKNAWLSFQIVNDVHKPYAHLWNSSRSHVFCDKAGNHEIICTIPKLRLYKGKYTLKVYFSGPPGDDVFDTIENICPFEVTMFGIEREFPWQDNACTYIEEATWNSKIL